jgi:hypothetical protein
VSFISKVLIVRDVVGKIANWLTEFKDFIDIAVIFDPVYAALPWVVVRFCLLVFPIA